MRYRPLRSVPTACSRVGRTARTVCTLLAVISIIFTAVFAAFAPGVLKERTSDLLFLGLTPALGFYVSGHILRHVVILGGKLGESIAIYCYRRIAPLTNDLSKWAIACGLDDPVDTCLTILARCLLTIRCWRVRETIFNSSCLLIRQGARFAIRMQTVWFLILNRRTWRELRASISPLYYLHKLRRECEPRRVILPIAFLAALGLGWIDGSHLYWLFETRTDEPGDTGGVNVVVERIIDVESNGNPNAKNKRSSATGPGQFLDETWLEMIRAHRPDLSRGRGESEILELRRDPNLSREITARFAERNATALRQQGLPVTPGTVYLAHFAGAAGAVAILSAPESADAALVMAKADATGRTKREKIIRANPFLERFTVADLKTWADRKMRGPGLD
jgi:hypothetical protein